MHRRLLRFATPQAVAQACAEHLLDELIARQADRETVHLCLTGGRIANELYTIFGSLVPGSGLDTSRLQLWWGDERFVPLIHPDRNSQQALAILAKSMPISSANTMQHAGLCHLAHRGTPEHPCLARRAGQHLADAAGAQAAGDPRPAGLAAGQGP